MIKIIEVDLEVKANQKNLKKIIDYIFPKFLNLLYTNIF